MGIYKAKSRGPAPFRVTKRLRTIACCVSFAIVVCVSFISISIINYIELENEGPNYDDYVYDYEQNGQINGSEYIACPIPPMNPFHKSIKHFLADKPPEMDCEISYPLLFNSTLRSTIVPAKEYDYFRKNGYESCCYRTVERDIKSGHPDSCERISPNCIDLSLSSETKIPVGHEFIAIYCQKIGAKERVMVDVHPFVHLRSRKKGRGQRRVGKGKLNVVIFGMESVSRMSFMRTMPESYSYLKKELDVVEMLGYNKIAEGTFPNLMAMLTSTKASEWNCIIKSRPNPYEKCPFIWKKYAAEGYHTSFAEDASATSIFKDSPGFTKQPTDYYLRPLSHWADDNFGRYPQPDQQKGCYGPRLTFQYLLDYMEKLVYRMSMRMNKRNFFHFSWATALTHDHQSAGLLGDPHLLRSLKWMKESGYLNDTVLILMSDHGHLGSQRFRTTIQGELEDRLPLLFFVFPDSFKKNYADAYANLLRNRDRLVTPFDLYETLSDILDPDAIRATSAVRKFAMFVAEKTSDLPRGISFFHSIPKSRTCRMAGIPREFCSCFLFDLILDFNKDL